MERKKRFALLVDYIASEYSEELIGGVSKFCNENNIDFLIFSCGELNGSKDDYNYQYLAITSLLTENNIDGIIFTAGTQMHNVTPEYFNEYACKYKPIPSVNVSIILKDIPSIVSDCASAYTELIDYMIEEQKCKKLLLMSVDSKSNEVVERSKVFYDSVKRHNIPSENVYELTAMFDYITAKTQLELYMKEHDKFDFDGIVCLNDDMAFACIDFCRNMGLNVPEDVVISGFDDLPRSSFSYMTLTTVNQRLQLQGYTAAETLLNVINGKNVPMVQQIPTKAILRGSTQRILYKGTDIDTPLISVEDYNSFVANNRYPVYEWYVKRNQLYQATKFFTDVNHDMTIVQLKKILNKDLKNFGISTLAIVIYDEPVETPHPFERFNLPNKAQVLTAFDLTTDFIFDIYDETVSFNPRESLLPENLQYFIHGDTIIISLFHGEIQYGYMIFDNGTFDMTVYDLLSKTISSLVASVFSFKGVHDEQKRLRDRWIKTDIMASTDQLTGIKNRRYFFDIGNATMTFANTVSQEGLVIFCDMDGLKKINDKYGHDAGDQAIVAEAKILQKNFRTSDVVARIAGDEFAIICQGITVQAFEKIKTRIEQDCVMWTMEQQAPFVLSISMGAVKYPSEKFGYDLDNLLSEADLNLYEEKKRKKSVWKNNS